MAKHRMALGDLGRRSLLRTWERAQEDGQAKGMQIPGQSLHFPAGLAEVDGWWRSTWGGKALAPKIQAGIKLY